MGTSKSFPGPPGRSPLLPPYAPDASDSPDAPVHPAAADRADAPDDAAGEPGGAEQGAGTDGVGPEAAGNGADAGAVPAAPPPAGPVAPSVTWRSPSGFARQLARSAGGAGRDRHRAVGRSFVRALGGARQAARSSRASRAAAVSLGAFLSGVARDGIVATAARFGFTEYLGRGVDALLAALARTFAPAGSDLDAAVVRRAELETLAALLERYDVGAAGHEALDALDEQGVRETMGQFVAECVGMRLLQALAVKVEESAVSAARAKEVEDELREYVAATLNLEFGTAPLTELAWDSREAAALVQRLYEDAYAVLEAEAPGDVEAAA
jgi:hypothetical protein